MPEHDTNPAERQDVALTRREWLLKLSEAAVLLGFSGTASGWQASGTTPTLEVTTQNHVELPPGLYEPSNDHLSHALAGDSLLHPIPAGTEPDYVRPRGGPYPPQFFSPSDFQTVQRMVELLLGEADGRSQVAASAGDDHENVVAVVAEWIDLRIASAAGVREAARRLAPDHRALAVAYYGTATTVEELESFDPEPTSREGLAWLREESVRRYGKPFLDLGDDQQVAILREISDERPDKAAETAGTRFFKLMKHEIIRGFYTSRLGLREIDYKGNAFYGESPGCDHDHKSPPEGRNH